MLALNDGVNVAKASVLFSVYQCVSLDSDLDPMK